MDEYFCPPEYMRPAQVAIKWLTSLRDALIEEGLVRPEIIMTVRGRALVVTVIDPPHDMRLRAETTVAGTLESPVDVVSLLLVDRARQFRARYTMGRPRP